MFPDAPEDPGWYLNASELPARWRSGELSVILDSTFVFERFATVCAAFDAIPGRDRRLHYLTVCPIGTRAPVTPPGSPSIWSAIHRDLARQWPLPLPGFHLIDLLEGRIRLHLALGEAAAQIPFFDARCDAFFLDGRLSSLASPLARLARHGSTLVLSKGSHPQIIALEKAGFLMKSADTQDAFIGHFRAQKRTRQHIPPTRSTAEREAIVIGAGMAGTAVSTALAGLGWRISLLEREPKPASRASGNLAAIFSPLLSRDDGHAARLSRACFLRLLQELRSLDPSSLPAHWAACGVLQLPQSSQEESHFRSLVLKHSYPEDFVAFLEKHEAEQRIGQVLPSGGWFFKNGGWLNPPSLCAARIAKHPKISAHFCQDVQRLEPHNQQWTALDSSGRRLASAPVVVLANAWEASALLPKEVTLPFKKVRGQVAHLPSGTIPLTNSVLSGEGYLTPPVFGRHCLGATYDFDSSECSFNLNSHETNLRRLSQLLPEAHPPTAGSPEGRVGFRSLTPDRMPMVGPIGDVLPAHPDSQASLGSHSSGLYGLLGLGSRGVVWSTLLGEYLAALIHGSPSPLPLDLAAHLNPARFAARTIPQK